MTATLATALAQAATGDGGAGTDAESQRVGNALKVTKACALLGNAQYAAAAAAVARAGTALGRGVAGLVNAHDPDVVVIGGLGPRLRGPAFDAAYHRGLMAFRRESPAPVRDSAYGDDAPLRGAAATALDHATSPEGLARAGD